MSEATHDGLTLGRRRVSCGELSDGSSVVEETHFRGISTFVIIRLAIGTQAVRHTVPVASSGYPEYESWYTTYKSEKAYIVLFKGKLGLYSCISQGRVPFLRRHISQALTRFFLSPFLGLVTAASSLSLPSSGEDIVYSVCVRGVVEVRVEALPSKNLTAAPLR